MQYVDDDLIFALITFASYLLFAQILLHEDALCDSDNSNLHTEE